MATIGRVNDNPPTSGTPIGRRLVLGMLGLGAAGVAAGPVLQRAVGSVISAVSRQDPTGLTALLPDSGGFEYYSVTGAVDAPKNYQLTVDGLVDKPASYGLADLQALPQHRIVHDVQCVTGWRVPGTPFEGVKLADLLDASGVRSGATAVKFSCFDGIYTESLTLDQARRDDVLVALKMQDKPVTHDHGGPVRLYVAPMYFYKSAKWLSGITLTSSVERGYWEGYGYDTDAWVGKSNGRDDAPTS